MAANKGDFGTSLSQLKTMLHQLPIGRNGPDPYDQFQGVRVSRPRLFESQRSERPRVELGAAVARHQPKRRSYCGAHGTLAGNLRRP